MLSDAIPAMFTRDVITEECEELGSDDDVLLTTRYNADTHDGPRSASRIRNGVSPLMFPNKCVVPKYASLVPCGSEVCFG